MADILCYRRGLHRGHRSELDGYLGMVEAGFAIPRFCRGYVLGISLLLKCAWVRPVDSGQQPTRSEERRVGKEC